MEEVIDKPKVDLSKLTKDDLGEGNLPSGVAAPKVVAADVNDGSNTLGEKKIDETKPAVIEESAPASGGEEGTDGGSADNAAQVEDAPVSIIGSIISHSGLDIKPDDFEDSEEGIVKLGTTLANKFIETSLDANPILKAAFELETYGGDSRRFVELKKEAVDIKTVNLDENEDAAVYIYRNSLLAQGLTVEAANSIVNTAKENKSLVDVAKALQPVMAKQIDDAANRIPLETQRAIEQEQKELATYWEGQKDIITNNKVKSFVVPETEKAAFFNYMSKPVRDGYSQADLDEANAELNELLLYTKYLFFKKGDVAAIVNRAAKTQLADSLTNRLKQKNGDGGASANFADRKSEVKSIAGLSKSEIS